MRNNLSKEEEEFCRIIRNRILKYIYILQVVWPIQKYYLRKTSLYVHS